MPMIRGSQLRPHGAAVATRVLNKVAGMFISKKVVTMARGTLPMNNLHLFWQQNTTVFPAESCLVLKRARAH